MTLRGLFHNKNRKGDCRKSKYSSMLRIEVLIYLAKLTILATLSKAEVSNIGRYI